MPPYGSACVVTIDRGPAPSRFGIGQLVCCLCYLPLNPCNLQSMLSLGEFYHRVAALTREGQPFAPAKDNVQLAESEAANTSKPQDLDTSVDPVCHGEMEIASAKHVADVEGITYYFCCPGCRARFVKDPQRYLSPAS